MIEDKRKSMRTSAIIHGLIILLAILPFLKSPLQPKEFKQAILVEFKTGSSNEGAQMSAPKMENESAAAAAAAEEVEVEEEREVIPETKPIKTTPPPAVLTSKTEPPLVPNSKVRKVEVKVPQAPAETIPQPTEVKDVPAPTKDIVLKPSKVKKVVVKIEQPPRKTGNGSKTGSATGNGKSDSKSTDSGNGDGGKGTSDSGKGKTDGEGKGDKGTGKADKGNGGKGKGKGMFNGDGILSRPIISNPDLSGIAKESGKISVNICVDRSGNVSDIEYNAKYSTVKNQEMIQTNS